MTPIDALNIASHSSAQNSRVLEKLMYLMWYEHNKDMNRLGGGVYDHMNYELLANKYYEEFGAKIESWSIPTRNIGDFV